MNRPHPSQPRCRGAVRDTIFIILVLGLIGLGIFYVIRLWGSATEQYATGMIQAHNQGEALACQLNLRAVYVALLTCVTSGDPIPQTKDELLEWCGGNKTFKCPDPNGGQYIYLPPKTIDTPKPVIIAFEPNAVHDGHFHVLFSDGTITPVSEEYLPGLMDKVTRRKRP